VQDRPNLTYEEEEMMTATTTQKISFEEFLNYDDGTDNVYELFNRELIEVPPESGLNVGITAFLFAQFLPFVGHRRVRPHGLELEVRGEPRNRFRMSRHRVVESAHGR